MRLYIVYFSLVYTLLSNTSWYIALENGHKSSGFILFPCLLSSKEEQHISSNFFTEVDLDHSPDGSFKIVSLWFWGIEDLNWVCAPRNALVEEEEKEEG